MLLHLHSLLERADRTASHVPLPDGGIERILRRRDRKRRNQRISAGVVGIVVFVAVVWVVTTTVVPTIRGGRETFREGRVPQRPSHRWLPEWDGPRLASRGSRSEHAGGRSSSRNLTSPTRTPQGFSAPFLYVYAHGRVLAWGGARTS